MPQPVCFGPRSGWICKFYKYKNSIEFRDMKQDLDPSKPLHHGVAHFTSGSVSSPKHRQMNPRARENVHTTGLKESENPNLCSSCPLFNLSHAEV